MNKIEISSISKSFGEKKVINDISLSIKEGSFTVLLGPSGCGKSTMLRIIAGLEKPDCGKILINNKDVTLEKPSKRALSMVFQSYALFPHINVKENILFGLKVKKIKKDIQEMKLKKVIDLVDLKDVLQSKPSQLSGGQKQRVALARAIISDHTLCLMDEPLSNLDAKLRENMRIELRSLQKKLSLSLLYVTHDQTEAMSMADHIILLNQGKIEQQGTPQDLYEKSQSTFVGRFIGTPPMNILEIRKENKEIFKQNFSNSITKNAHYLGIRPEDIKLNSISDGLEGVILFLDYHGSDIILGLQFEKLHNETKFLVRIQDKLRYKIGDRVWVNWEEEKIHIFNSEGLRL